MKQDEMYIAFGGNLKTYKADNGTVGMVEGMGVLFGNESQKDLDGQYFTPDTFYGHDYGNNSMATLNHGIPMVKGDTRPEEIPHLIKAAGKRFKNPITTEVLDTGILTRHALDLSDEYEKWVYDMTEQGKFKRSSGALGHMVDADDSSGEIKQWPIGEFAYTPTPAEPRLGAIQPLKSYKAGFIPDEKPLAMVDDNPEAQQEDGRTPSVSATIEPTPQDEIKTITKDKNIMTEQVKETVAAAPVADNSEVLAAIKALTSEVEALKATPKVELGVAGKAVNIVEPTSLGDEKVNYRKSFWDFMGSGGQKAVKALEAGVDGEGGYLVPEDDALEIAEIATSMSAVRQLPLQERTTSRQLYHWPTVATHTGAMVTVAEEITYDVNDPVFGEALFTMAKRTRRITVSEELLNDDNSGLQATINRQFAQALALAENVTLVAAVTAGTTSTVAFAGAAAITAAEVVEMYMGNADGYPTNGWLMAKATGGLIYGLSGNHFSFLPTPSGSLEPQIMGAPVVFASAMPAATTGLESVYAGDWSQVGIVRNGGLNISFNPYLSQATGQVDFFASARFDIQVLQGLALTIGTQA